MNIIKKRIHTQVIALILSFFLPSSAWCAVAEYTPQDVSAYVDAMFSEQVKPIRKWGRTIYAEIQWPGCEDVARDMIVNLRQKSGIDVVDVVSGHLKVATIEIIGSANPEMIMNQSGPKKIFMLFGEDHYKKRLNEIIDGKQIIEEEIERDNEVLAVFSLINTNIHGLDVCRKDISVTLFDALALVKPHIDVPNSIRSHGDSLTNMDMLYLSALYDKSVAVGESPQSAKVKIIKLMTDRLGGNKQ